MMRFRAVYKHTVYNGKPPASEASVFVCVYHGRALPYIRDCLPFSF